MQNRLFKIGYGYDSHRFLNAQEKLTLWRQGAISNNTEYFAKDKKLVIGGLQLEEGLQKIFGPFKARSDGDVLYHAITNCLLSAHGDKQARDIGKLFPNTDEKNSNRNSADFVQKAVDLIKSSDYELIELKIMFKGVLYLEWDKIESNIAEFFSYQNNEPNIHLQATSGEEMDDAGCGLGVEVFVVCLLQHKMLTKLMQSIS